MKSDLFYVMYSHEIADHGREGYGGNLNEYFAGKTRYRYSSIFLFLFCPPSVLT